MIETLDPRLSSFIAAIFISLARILYRAALTRIGVGLSTVIMSLVSALAGYILMKIEGKVVLWPIHGILWFVGVGLSANLIGRYFSLVSINLVGLSRTSILMQTSLVWSSAFAVIFLDENINIYLFLGTLAVMCGSILLVYEKNSNIGKIPLSHYFVPVFTAVTFAIAHLFGKYGLHEINSAPFAQIISNTTAFVGMLVIFIYSKEYETNFWNTKPILTVSLGALFNAGAAYFFWTALRTGDIVQIIPINRLNVLMIVFLSWLFYREQESISRQVVAGGVMSVLGAYFVAMG